MVREREAGLPDRFLDEGAHAQHRVLDLLLLQVESIATGMRPRERRLILRRLQEFIDLLFHAHGPPLGATRRVRSFVHPNRPDT